MTGVDTIWTPRAHLDREPTPSIQFPSRESGGTGRRAGFRILWGKTRGGSSPPFRTRGAGSRCDELSGRHPTEGDAVAAVEGAHMMMQCPRCSTRWRVAAASPMENPLFKCGRCHHLFRQFPGAPAPTEPAAVPSRRARRPRPSRTRSSSSFPSANRPIVVPDRAADERRPRSSPWRGGAALRRRHAPCDACRAGRLARAGHRRAARRGDDRVRCCRATSRSSTTTPRTSDLADPLAEPKSDDDDPRATDDRPILGAADEEDDDGRRAGRRAPAEPCAWRTP